MFGRVLCLAVLFLGTAEVLASARHNKIPREYLETYTYREDGKTVEALIRGFRYLNPKTGKPNSNGRKVLLLHGFHSTPHAFDNLVDDILLNPSSKKIKELSRQGYDIYAFAFRGHGLGADDDEAFGRSYVPEYQDGDYKFENQFEDFAAMLDFIEEIADEENVPKQNRKVSVVGHSMGGMVPAAALALYPRLRDNVRVLVNIESPNDFSTEKVNPILYNKALIKNIYKWISNSKSHYPLLKPDFKSNGFVQSLKQKLIETNFESLLSWNPVLRDYYNFIHFGVKAGGPAHRDLILSMFSFGLTEDYPYKELDPGVPVVNVYGGRDGIAPKDSIIKQFHAINKMGGQAWLVGVPEADHIDILLPGKLDGLLPYLLLAINDPNYLGKAGSQMLVKPYINPLNKLRLSCMNLFVREL